MLDVGRLLAKQQQLWERLSRSRDELLTAAAAQLDGELGPIGLAAAQAHQRVLEHYGDMLHQLHRELWDPPGRHGGGS